MQQLLIVSGRINFQSEELEKLLRIHLLKWHR
jgi:hypothetical protein